MLSERNSFEICAHLYWILTLWSILKLGCYLWNLDIEHANIAIIILLQFLADSIWYHVSFTFTISISLNLSVQQGAMDFLFKGFNEDTSDCQFDEKNVQRCPFLRNINKPTNFSFFSVNFPSPVSCRSLSWAPFCLLAYLSSC